jgi:hypothetical protein
MCRSRRTPPRRGLWSPPDRPRTGNHNWGRLVLPAFGFPFISHCNNSKGQSLFPAGFSEGRGPAPDLNVTARVLPHSVVHDVQRALRVVCYADHGVSSLRKRDFEFTYGPIFLKRRAIALRESIVLPRKVPFGADQACRGESLGKRTINRPRSQSSMSRPSMNR